MSKIQLLNGELWGNNFGLTNCTILEPSNFSLSAYLHIKNSGGLEPSLWLCFLLLNKNISISNYLAM